MTNTYTDCLSYKAAPTALVLDGYIGNIGRISVTTLGATSLTPTAPLTASLSQYDAVYVFDGPSSELLQVGSGGAAIGATSIPLQSATLYAHAGGTPYCTDGADGSLGEQIFTASKWIEDEICFQPLWSTTYTGEVLTMPTMRAALDNECNIHFRPRHFPITNLAAVSIKVRSTTTPYDPAQATVDSDQQTVDLPLDAILPTNQQGQGSPYNYSTLRRSATAWVYITYTSGFAVGALPWTIKRACNLLTSECFQQLENPMGADSIQQNKRKVDFMLRGDQSGESLLVKQAIKLLSAYITESF